MIATTIPLIDGTWVAFVGDSFHPLEFAKGVGNDEKLAIGVAKWRYIHRVERMNKEGCEWNPVKGAAAMPTDHHHRSHKARWIIPMARGETWRVCDYCASLFNHKDATRIEE